MAINGGERTVKDSPPKWPFVTDEDIEAVVKALRKSRDDPRYLSAAGGGGPLEELEREFARKMGATYALSTNSGAAALHIALAACEVGPGDEVIVPAYTWGQSAGVILHQNAIPVFADIDPKTYNLDPQSLEERITERTKAVIVVHLYGHPADMDAILDVAEKHGIFVIEDCAQALGAKYKGRYVGTFGHFGCFSVGDGKNIIGGEGGVLLTNDRNLYERALLEGMHPARQNAELTDDSLKPYVDALGHTYRMHPLAAVIARSQLKHLDEWNEMRRRNAEYLSTLLSKIPGVEPPFVAPHCEHVYHQYSPSYFGEQLKGLPRERFIRALQAEGVPIWTYVNVPLHLRRRFQERKFYGKGCPFDCPHAGRRVEYREGDCPVAEERCKKRELNMGSTSWFVDLRPLMEQYAAAFQKVAENVDELL